MKTLFTADSNEFKLGQDALVKLCAKTLEGVTDLEKRVNIINTLWQVVHEWNKDQTINPLDFCHTFAAYLYDFHRISI